MTRLLHFLTITNVIYLFFFIWAIVSIRLIRKTIKGYDVNEYFYASIPNVFTTLGILGTFLGIYAGLQDFDTNDINASIPNLLTGLKSAFLTSILGIVLSLIFGRLSELAIGFAHSNNKKSSNNSELQALNAINTTLIALRNDSIETNQIFKEQRTGIQEIKNAIGSNQDNSLLSQLKELRIDAKDNFNSLGNYLNDTQKELNSITTSLGGDAENSLLSQLKKLRVDSNDNNKTLITYLNGNKAELHEKFNEFATLLAENNTEALVDVMKAATEEFNEQMSDLINRLVQENFSELNNSVRQLNDWQVENKKMVSDLTIKHKETVNQFDISSKAIEKISTQSELIVSHAKQLVDEKSKLQQMISALSKVIVEDERFENSTKNLLNAITKVEKNIDAFDKTTHKLNDWVQREYGIKETTTSLLVKLDEVSKIRAYNGEFWDETKKQLGEGTQLIKNNTAELATSLDGINQEFQSQLGDILGSLDLLIQRLITKANEN